MRVIRTRDSKESLCDSCTRYEEIPLCGHDLELGDGAGNDNIIACSDCTIRQNNISKTIYVGGISKTNKTFM